ncbi:hypothetical protein L1049_008562 [Liquidambar formosana]|uniref:poly(A)-specific ribonuclease n=1 Tax=Liquidambar formosana TaxID=63359 RepID=A0AAP0X8C7_LIQFO
MSAGESPPIPKPVRVRSVWAANLESEFDLIGSTIDHYPFISMDTEFPGVVFRQVAGSPGFREPHPTANYYLLKANVDLLKLIQIGITLSDAAGNLPDLGTGLCYIWEFNFRDFDVTRDTYASDSVELLRRQGIDFEMNRRFGIDSVRFAELMMSSGLVCNDSVTWVTFQGAHDFGYLLKILTQRELPADMGKFLGLLRLFFGARVYDVKHLASFSGCLFGGLDKISESLGVERVAGKCHQAGSDCLVTSQAFQRIKEVYFCKGGLEKYAGVLHGLEVS